jgi:hypothetical protein
MYERLQQMKKAMMFAMPVLGLFVVGCDTQLAYSLGIGAAVIGGSISIIQFVLQGLGLE